MMLFRTGCRALGKTGTTGKQPRGETATRQIYIYVYVKVILYYRALVRWCAGALVRWCAGALVRWCAGALVRWCAGALSAGRQAEGRLSAIPGCLGAIRPPDGNRISCRIERPARMWAVSRRAAMR
jgi:hypothetical protein